MKISIDFILTYVSNNYSGVPWMLYDNSQPYFKLDSVGEVIIQSGNQFHWDEWFAKNGDRLTKDCNLLGYEVKMFEYEVTPPKGGFKGHSMKNKCFCIVIYKSISETRNKIIDSIIDPLAQLAE